MDKDIFLAILALIIGLAAGHVWGWRDALFAMAFALQKSIRTPPRDRRPPPHEED